MRTLGSLFETDIPTSRYHKSRSAIVKRAGPARAGRSPGETARIPDSIHYVVDDQPEAVAGLIEQQAAPPPK
jgi:hypothetical protein